MKTILTVLSSFLLSLVVLQAQDVPATAWNGLVQEQKPLKDAMIIGAQLTESSAGQVWEFQVIDTNYKTERRILRWSGGALSADSSGRLRAFDRGDLIPLGSANLVASVAPVRAKTKQLLADAGKKPNSIQYALSRREGQDVPLWNVYCLDGEQNRIAEMSFTSGSNQLLAVNLEPLNPKVESVKTEAKTTGRTIEKTFKGIGADLEQFFTGKRTVDK